MPKQPSNQQQIDDAKRAIELICSNIETVIQGKHRVVRDVVLALMARGHVLLEDYPGTGKTTLVSTLAKSIDCGFSRIQFTPDVMPSDVSGFSIYNQKTQQFEFREGGVMSNLVLADEINRASPKTQSAMLEAMEERQVTVEKVTYPLDEPFMVLATQNPIEQGGTFKLPEAQLDRFMVKMSMGYPGFNDEVLMLKYSRAAKLTVRPVLTGDDVENVRSVVESVYISDAIFRYVVQIVEATRGSVEIALGSSPRGGIALCDMARALAVYNGRSYVLADDIQELAKSVLRHRIILRREAMKNERTPDAVIDSVLAGIDVPRDDTAMGQV